jgi:ribonuclease R
VLSLFTDGGRSLLGSREIVRKLGLIRSQLDPLQKLLRRLVKKGVLEAVGGRFRMRRQDGWVEGLLERHADGSPLVRDGDRLLRLGEVGDAREGDRVRVKEFGPTQDAQAELLEVLEGARDVWVGRLDRGREGHVLTPYRGREDEALPISTKDLCGAEVGDMVLADFSAGGAGRRGSGLRVVERLGRPGDAEADFRAVAWYRRLPMEFSPESLLEAEAIPGSIGAAEIGRRLDLRDRFFITIDPETARDHDDAVYVEATASGGARLWVAIADVSHFVDPGSAIDADAWLRGNSVYFPGRSIPMLPERISSDLCSLRPGVDRLVMAVEMDVDSAGKIGRTRLHEAVIRSRQRLSYGEAAEVLDSGSSPGTPLSGIGSTDRELAEQLRAFGQVTGWLGSRREAALSMDFDLPSPEVIFDAAGRPRDIGRAVRGPAHRAVEEAMLAANQAVAQALIEYGEATVFRIHEPPGADDLQGLATFYSALGLRTGGRGGVVDRAGMARALRESRARSDEAVIHYSTLRAMKQARYASTCSGHFALGFDAYLHFTSPIRRYADLVVHRTVRRMLRGKAASPESNGWVERVAVRTSARERVAVTAERERMQLARCAVMSGRVGDRFEGTITGVSGHGLYITLDAPFVEGMVRISRLSGFLDYDPLRHRLVARSSQFQYGIGDRLKVELVAVNAQRGWIDLEPVPESGAKSKTPGGQSTRARSTSARSTSAHPRRAKPTDTKPRDTKSTGAEPRSPGVKGSPESGSGGPPGRSRRKKGRRR